MSYLVHSDGDRKKILKTLGIKGAEELFSAIPQKVLGPKIKMPASLNESELSGQLKKLGDLNNPLSDFSSFLGAGAYNHYVPSVVNTITSISQFYTAYTPYQAEISQGTLQYIFEFQSLICRLTGMDIANASMYDGASSLAEAILLAGRVTNKKKVVLASTIDPQYRQTVASYIQGLDIRIVEAGYDNGITDTRLLTDAVDESTCAVVLQNPNFFGCFEDVFAVKKILDGYPDCLYIICANPLSFSLLKPPSEYGADIVAGDAQCFGNTLSFGGPYLGYFATTQKYLRQIPGRIVSRTSDRDGKVAYVLTYQTREQHIRKTKATSNICSNHSLNALAATVYLSLLGENGLKRLAMTCIQGANYFSKRLLKTSHFRQKFDARFFNEIVITTDLDVCMVLEKLYRNNILGGIDLGKYYPGLSGSILVSFTELNPIADIDKYIDVLKEL